MFLNSFNLGLELSEFSLNLFKNECELQKDKNVVISPLSVYQSLGLISNGAKEETLQEILKVFEDNSLKELNDNNYHYLNLSKKYKSIIISNAIFSKINLLENFKKIIKQYNSFYSNKIDINIINKWCSDKTKKKIPKIIDDIDTFDIFIILNVIYFKNEWKIDFIKNETKEDNFYINNNKIQKVLMMYVKNDFKYYSDNDCQIIELLYKKDDMSAIIILPKNNIDEFINNLTKEKMINYMKKLLLVKNIKLYFPKLKNIYQTELKQNLNKLGINYVFDINADFSGISEIKKGLFINKIIQKTYLEINEKYTEAAAATFLDMRGKDIIKNEEEIEMRVDKPFLFFIRNKNFDKNQFIYMSKIVEINDS